MRRLLTFGLIFAALLFFGEASYAQDKAFQTTVLQKLDELNGKITELNNRLNEMDKRYEVRFTKIEERFNTIDERFNRIEDKIAAVNQRIDDKFNLLSVLLGLMIAVLALPSVPKFLERFKARPEGKDGSQNLQEQIDQLKAQIAQLMGRPTQ